MRIESVQLLLATVSLAPMSARVANFSRATCGFHNLRSGPSCAVFAGHVDPLGSVRRDLKSTQEWFDFWLVSETVKRSFTWSPRKQICPHEFLGRRHCSDAPVTEPKRSTVGTGAWWGLSDRLKASEGDRFNCNLEDHVLGVVISSDDRSPHLAHGRIEPREEDGP